MTAGTEPLAHTLHTLTVAALQQRCQDEQAERRLDGTACFELLRRALDEDDAAAWQSVEAQFRLLVIGWLLARIEQPPDEATLDDLWADTRERFLRYVNRPIANHYPHTGALLNYWRRCATTTAIDYQRQRAASSRWQAAMGQQLLVEQASRFEDEHTRSTFANCVQHLIREHVTDESTRFLIYLRFELDLAPRVIAERYPDQFATPRIVYQQLDALKKRLRRVFDLYLERCL
jgi:hypothetical protein